MSAFVQFSLEPWDAWKRGELSDEELDLAMYVGFETDFRTGQLTRTLLSIASDLRWTCSFDTVARRLAKLRTVGLVEFEITRRRHYAYVIEPTERLLRVGRMAHLVRSSSALSDPPGADLISLDAELNAELNAEFKASSDEGLRALDAELGAELDAEPLRREEKRREQNRSTQTAPQDLSRGERHENGRPRIGDAGYPAFLAAALVKERVTLEGELVNGHVTELEVERALAGHRLVELRGLGS